MARASRYLPEHALIVVTMLLTVSGFWTIYLGERAAPAAHHHLHLATVAAWLVLLRTQLGLVDSRKYASHARVGAAILGIGPILVASGALLSVHSAAKDAATGEGDFLLVQNVGTTFTLALLIALAFILRKRRKLHGNLLLGTVVLFLGIAIFFTLVSFVPGFVVTGPETFHRFRTAATTGKVITLVVGIAYFLRDRRSAWPFLVAPLSFFLNDLVLGALLATDRLVAATAAVGAVKPAVAFGVTALAMLVVLLVTGVRVPRRGTAPSDVALGADGSA